MAVRPIEKNTSTKPIQFGVIGLLGLVALALWLLLPMSNSSDAPIAPAALRTPSQAMLYGAIHYSSVNDSLDPTCTREGVTFRLLDNTHYTVQMILSTSLLIASKPGIIALGEGAELGVHLLDTNDAVYRSFSAAEGSVELTQAQGRLSAILYDEAGEQLVVNVRWSCPELK